VYQKHGAVEVDGDLREWKDVPARTRTSPEHGPGIRVSDRFAWDVGNLYLAFAVADPTPAVNRCNGKESLWNGDALEMYVSRNGRHTGWQPGDWILHIAASEENHPVKAGLLNRATGKWTVPIGVRTATSKWGDGKGYNLEAQIPLEVFGIESLRAGHELLLDWDICFSNEREQWGFKVYRSEKSGRTIMLNTGFWGWGRCVRRPGEERALYVRKDRGDWTAVPVQARLEVEETQDMYGAELQVAADDDGLKLRFHVRDPDPALCTPGDAWLGTGDFAELFVDNRHIHIVASPAYPTPYARQGGNTRPIAGGKTRLEVAEQSYTMDVFLPWHAVGGRKETYRFNWNMAWSDKTGGSAFARRALLGTGETTTLVLLEK
jgi:hypothetical protein